MSIFKDTFENFQTRSKFHTTIFSANRYKIWNLLVKRFQKYTFDLGPKRNKAQEDLKYAPGTYHNSTAKSIRPKKNSTQEDLFTREVLAQQGMKYDVMDMTSQTFEAQQEI
jgi:hypothetical protein